MESSDRQTIRFDAPTGSRINLDFVTTRRNDTIILSLNENNDDVVISINGKYMKINEDIIDLINPRSLAFSEDTRKVKDFLEHLRSEIKNHQKQYDDQRFLLESIKKSLANDRKELDKLHRIIKYQQNMIEYQKKELDAYKLLYSQKEIVPLAEVDIQLDKNLFDQIKQSDLNIDID